MAVRPTVLFIGDLTVAGDRPASELALVNPTYTSAQSDCKIWNIQTQTWQDLTPGTNTNSVVPGSDRWSFEARFRESLRDQFPTETLWVLKYATSSSVRDWSSTVYTSMIAQLTAAAVSAGLSSDTIRVDAVVISIQTADFRLSTRQAYGDLLQALVDTLLAQIPTIPGCSVGSIRNDGGRTPVVVVEPHYAYLTPLDVDKAGLQLCRMQAQGLENVQERLRVVRVHNTTSSDNLTFSSGSMISLAARVGEAMLAPTAYDDGVNPEARMVLVIGDSIVEGTNEALYPGAGNIASLPTHLQSAVNGARIWNPFAGAFQTLQVAVNNQISLPGVLEGYGPEVTLADELRGSGDVWVVKGTAIGTFGSLFTGQHPAPTYFGRTASWPTGARRQMWDLAVRGWLRSAVDSIRTFSAKTPQLELVVICVGTNDVNLPTYASPDDVPLVIESMVRALREELLDLGIASTPKFAVCVPATTEAGTELLNAMRESIQALADRLDDVSLVDLAAFATIEGTHPTAAATQALGRAFYEVWRTGTASAVQPMFMPSMLELRQALRLSKIGQDNDTLHQIDAAVQAVKTGFFQHLGAAKIGQIQAIAYTKAPKTDADMLRVLAASTETKWVRSQLMRTMPLLFMDGSSTVQSWQEDAAFRNGSFLQTRDELRRLDDEIKQNLSMLQSAVIEGAGSVSIQLVTPDNSISPGQSVLDVF